MHLPPLLTLRPWWQPTSASTKKKRIKTLTMGVSEPKYAGVSLNAEGSIPIATAIDSNSVSQLASAKIGERRYQNIWFFLHNIVLYLTLIACIFSDVSLKITKAKINTMKGIFSKGSSHHIPLNILAMSVSLVVVWTQQGGSVSDGRIGINHGGDWRRTKTWKKKTTISSARQLF